VRNVLELLVANIGVHLSDETLSRLVSGELSSSKLHRAQRHLSKCWKCRSRHERLERAAMGFVELHKQLIPPSPAETSQWRATFLARLDQVAAEVPPSWWSRLLSQFRFAVFTNMNPLLASVAVVFAASVILFFIWQRAMRSVSANELLQRAEASDNSLWRSGEPGVVYQKVRIHAPSISVERDLYRDREGHRKPKVQASAGESVSLKAKLNVAGVDWDEPLSAVSYREWHDRQEFRKDEIKRSGKKLITLTTKAINKAVAEESLTVREDDFHPVRRTVELVDVGTVEISELNYAVLSWSAVNENLFEALTPAVPPAPPTYAKAVPAAPVAPTVAQLLAAELQARVALHTVGADLGEQIEVARGMHGAAVVVRGLASTAERKQGLLAALKGIPNLDVRVRSVDEATATQETEELTPPNRVVAVSGHPVLEEKLVERFPKVEDRSAFVNRALGMFDQALAHAWALRRLEERYTGEEVERLSQADRQTLELLIRDHVATTRQELFDGEAALQSLDLQPATAPGNEGNVATEEDWRPLLNAVFDSVQKTERDVATLLAGVADVHSDADAVSRELQDSLSRAKAQLSVLSDGIKGPFLSGKQIGVVPTEIRKQEQP